ncbi:hypothetical protein FRC09_005836 [Ceratobasidium sp. 395]|nr:hypothetical protein FRC09_005836 [Ceratobasidium sp. 395]
MEVLEAYTNNLGAIDPSTRAARWSLVQIYLSQGKLEDVAKISGEVEKDRNLEILKTDELGKLQLLLLKAQIDAERGRWDKAARLQEEILELSIQLHGEEDAKTLNAQKTLSEILLNIPSRPAKTEVPAKRVVKSHKRKFDGKDPVARPAKRHLPVPRELAGCFVEFVGAVLQEALEAGEQELEPTHPENLKVRLSLGTNLMQQDRWPEARKILTLTEELEQALRAQPELHLQFLAVHGMLGCQDDEIASFVETLPAHYIFHNRDDTDHVQ